MKTTKVKRDDVAAGDALHRSLHALRQRTEIAEAHQRRLEQELPKMRKENQRLMAFLQDAAAFIRHSENNNVKEAVILTTLAHDIVGLANDEPCFSPRVTGYAEAEQEAPVAT